MFGVFYFYPVNVHRLTIKKLAEEDRPREKLIQRGKSSLTDAELIAILIGSGNKEQTAVELSQYMLSRCNHNLNNLAQLSLSELQKFNGIGAAKAITILGALELGRRRKEQQTHKKIKITSSDHTFKFIEGDLIDLAHEEFWLIFLKRNNDVIKKEMLSKGGVAGTVVDIKLIFKRALEEVASGLIVAHNHPSGNLRPSQEDIKLTQKIEDAAKALDIRLLDHLIVTNDGFYSFADNNMIN